MLSTAAQVRGAAGALMDGCTRDIKAIRAMSFPVFHGGIAPLDSKGRGRVMAIDVPVRCGGVKVASGDLIFGDADGVVVIPRAIEEQVLTLAFEKIKGEKRTLDDLRAGEKLGDVFAKYGILLSRPLRQPVAHGARRANQLRRTERLHTGGRCRR